MIPINEKDDNFICDLQSPCFQKLPSEAIQLIKNSKTQVLFRKGDNICKQGTFASYILFIVEGIAIQYLEGDSGKNINIDIVKTSEFIGLDSVFSNDIYKYSTLAITDCHVILVDISTLLQVMNNNGKFAVQLMNRYTKQNTNLFDVISKLQFKQMNGRLASVLLYINNYKLEFPDIFINLTRKQIAEFAGISTESSIKLLKVFERDGIISLNNKDISIVNQDALLQLIKIG